MLNEKVTNFREFGLSKQAKFMYVFTTENSYVMIRPVEYHGYRHIILAVLT